MNERTDRDFARRTPEPHIWADMLDQGLNPGAEALFGRTDGAPAGWAVSRTPVSYPEAVAAIGVKLRRWVSFHGISLNIEPDLSHFAGIVPCGITEHGVTSLVDLGLPVTMDDADAALKAEFVRVFGPVVDAAPPV